MCFFGKNVKNIAIKGTNLVGLYRVPRGYIDFSRRERYSKGNLWGGSAEMEEHTLKGEYISVLKDGRLSYGGSQRWSDSPVLRGYGCGVIAALDLLLYLARQRTDCRWLTVSSWGHTYRLSREEFDAYRREASASLLCTRLDVREK